MIRKGNQNEEPMVVFIQCWSESAQSWLCDVLNKRDIVLSKEDCLLEFDYKKFNKRKDFK